MERFLNCHKASRAQVQRADGLITRIGRTLLELRVDCDYYSP